MNEVSFKATKVFHEIWSAVNDKVTEGSNTAHRYKLIVEEGSSRSSKTWSNFQVLFLYLMQYPLTSITVLRDTQKSCRDIVEKDWKLWLKDPNNRKKEYEKGEIEISELDKLLAKENLTQLFTENKTNHTWTLKHNGNVIRFTGLDDEDDAMGMTQTICWINEPYNFSHEVYRQLAQRSKFIIFDWNPKQNHWIEKEKLKKDTFVHYSTFRDNPFISVESKRQILSYQPLKYCELVTAKILTEAEAKIYNVETNPKNFSPSEIKELNRCVYNELVGSSSEYHWLVYGLGLKAEKPNKIYRNWKAITLEDYKDVAKHGYTRYYGLDYGFANPTACVEVIYNGDMSFYIRPLLYKPMREMSAPLGEILKSKGVPTGNVTFIWADSADREPGEEIHLTNDLRANYSLNAVKMSKPSYKARFEFINKVRIYYVADDDFENEYENYEYWYVNDQNTEKPIKKNDHYMNAVEYCIWGIKEYLDIMI